ncbi:MAG TPA: SDR family oxidoreductase, partial [Mycobacterium sp.]|nr:SDR family oxidoreductase [Mycobacterium sp.]
LEVTTDDFRRVLDVNVIGVFHTVKRSLPHLASSTNPSITLVGSDSGFVAAKGMLAYNASKGALVQLTRALSLELFEDHGIRVNSVCPSIVDTPMARRGMGVENFDDADFPVNAAADVAWSIAYLASARSRAVNGVNLLSDFGYSARSSFPA